MSFVLPPMDGLNAVLLGEGVQWSFRAPNGMTIAPGTTKDRADYQYIGGEGMASFRLQNPMSGRWTVDVQAPGSDSAEAYGIDVQIEGDAPEVAHLEAMANGSDPNLALAVRPGETIFVRTFITKREKPIIGGRWYVRARTPRDSVLAIAVYDDGRHADGGASDGVYVGALRAESTSGVYKLRAEGQAPDSVKYVVTGTVKVKVPHETGHQ